MNKIRKKIKKIRLHQEGTHILVSAAIILLIINIALYWGLECKWPFYIVALASLFLYSMMVNFFRCPIRLFNKDTEKIVVAPADGKVVVVEEVDEHEYFHDRRLMVSIFMSITNVHANWYPVDGTVKHVSHQKGRFMKAWLPKASTENERSTIVIETPEGHTVMARQIAGAVARRIVTYAEVGEECYIDEHMGFIKFGSRVDVYLPLGTEICVRMGQKTVGNITVGKRGRGNQRGIGNPHSVMQFKLFFDPAQNGNRFFNRRFGYEHRLKTPCQRRVFFHVLFIFGKCGRPQTMQLSAGQRRLQQIGSIHRPFRRTGADDRMHFINKQNDSAV